MNKDQIELLGDNHVSSNVETPLLPNAFDKSDEEKSPTSKRTLLQLWKNLAWT